MNTLAPIVLFVYNRPYHTRQTVEALRKNELASDSELFIYSDAPKNSEAKQAVKEVREYIRTIDGFKKVTIIEREENFGLDNSIMDGVTKIVNKYGKIIVLEDDLVTSPYFLRFMNEALEFYENEKRVWHISGWNYPIDTERFDDVFLWRVMNCWGWATWADRWKSFERNLEASVGNLSKEEIKIFNVVYGDFWAQVKHNLKNKDWNWDIRWYSTIFSHKGLCLNPIKSFVQNIGLDGSGIHCGIDTMQDGIVLNNNSSIRFVSKIEENDRVVQIMRKYFQSQKKPFLKRLKNKINIIRFFR